MIEALLIVLVLVLTALVAVLIVRLAPLERRLEELRAQIASGPPELAAGVQSLQSEQARIARSVGEAVQSVSGQLVGSMHSVSTQITSGVQSLSQEQVRVAQTLGQVTESVSALRQFQDDVKQQLAVMGKWAELLTSLSGESRSMLQRMQLLLAGTPHRGAAGESILREILSALPAGLRYENLRMNDQVVEYAIKLPGERFLPIDSKWPGVTQLAALETEEDPTRRAALLAEIDRMIAKKAQEVAKYLDPERTLMLGVAAVPDAVFAACSAAHVRAFQSGVVVLPYSLTVPYVLSLLVLFWRFGQALDTGRLQASVSRLEQCWGTLEAELDGRFARALTMLQNTQAELRATLRDCKDATGALRASSVDLEAMSRSAPIAMNGSSAE